MPIRDEVSPRLTVVGERGDGFERSRVLAKGSEVRACEAVSRVGFVGFLLVHAHQLARLLVWQRSEQHRLTTLNTAVVPPMPDGERGDHDRRETRAASKLSTAYRKS